MNDHNKTKKQLLQELEQLRSQNARLQQSASREAAWEQAARKGPNHAENVLETLREPLLVLNQDLRIISVNRSFYQTFQLTPGETIGNSIYELGNKQWDIPELRELLENILPEKQNLEDFEVEHDFREIGHKSMLLNAREIYDNDLGTKTILLAIEDTTQQKRAKEMLKESEELYRRLFETANDGIVLLEKSEGKITHVNPAIERMLGYSNIRLVGYKLRDIGIAQGLDDFRTIMHALDRDGIVHYDDVAATTISGQDIEAEIYLVDRSKLVQCNIRDISRHKQIEREREQLAAELGDLYENAPCGYHSLDKEGFFTRINATELSWLGYSREEIIGEKKFTDLVTANSREKFRTNFPVLQELGWINDLEFEMICRDGTVFPVLLNATAIRDASGNFLRSRSTIIDITERKRTEEALKVSEERFRRIFDEGPFGMLVANPDSRIVMANNTFCTLLGYSEAELVGKTIPEITHEEDIEKSREFARQLLERSPVVHLDKRYVKKDGGLLWAKITASAILGQEGDQIHALVIIEDMTERRKAEEKIRLMAYYDSLTQLPNLTFHKELTKKSIARARRYNKRFAIIYTGIDNLKRINDTLGYHTGDLLLQAVANRISHFLRESDHIARSVEDGSGNLVSRGGGDEFIILMHNLNQPEDAARPANRLLEELSAPYELNNREVFITVSMGIALYPDNGTNVEELQINAEKAMRHSKSKGINNFHFYSKSMHSAVRELLNLENDLHRALEREELLLYYQPKVNAETRTITGLEALLRWSHPDKGMISPMQFIPLAENSGLILPMGEFVIRTVCQQIRTWQEAGCPRIHIALNVSSQQFEKQELISIIKSALQDTMVSPRSLGVELTESTIMKNPERSIQILSELKELGIESAIDDFGTGYSSLSYLKQLPVNFLKIDKSFIDGVMSDPRDQSIVKTTIVMAHSLNLRTIAEGVETDEQLSFLQEHASDEIQGYLFSKPMPAEEIPSVLSRNQL